MSLNKSLFFIIVITLFSCKRNTKNIENELSCIGIDSVILYKYTNDSRTLALYEDKIAYHFSKKINDTVIYMKVLNKYYRLEKAEFDSSYYEYIIKDLSNYNLNMIVKCNQNIISFNAGGELNFGNNSKTNICQNLKPKVFFFLNNHHVDNNDSIALKKTIQFKPIHK